MDMDIEDYNLGHFEPEIADNHDTFKPNPSYLKKAREFVLDLLARDRSRKIISKFKERDALSISKMATKILKTRSPQLSMHDYFLCKSLLIDHFTGRKINYKDSNILANSCYFDKKEKKYQYEFYPRTISGSNHIYPLVVSEMPIGLSFKVGTRKSELKKFIDDNWDDIIFLYKKFSEKNPSQAFPKRVRIKTKREINSIIYEHRNKTKKELYNALIDFGLDAFTAVDYSNYDRRNAITRLEEKRRNTEK